MEDRLTLKMLRDSAEKMRQHRQYLPLFVPQWAIKQGIELGLVQEVDGKFYHLLYGELICAEALKN
jgi:hypothetical protein